MIKLSDAQDNVIVSMIQTMAHKKTTNVFVVLNNNSVVKVGGKNTFAQVNYLDTGKFKLRLRTPDALFDEVQIRTLRVLVSKGVLVLDNQLSKGNTYVYKWDYNNKDGYPMHDNIRKHLVENGVKLT